jgi:predicted CoA-binding protein
MDSREKIEAFLNAKTFAVVGASQNRAKYGNKVLRAYMQNGRKAYPVNPSEKEVEGLTAYPDLASLPEVPEAVSIITPPPVTEQIVEQAAATGSRHIWMQPGAESEKAMRRAEELGLNVIGGGPCILVTLRYHE